MCNENGSCSICFVVVIRRCEGDGKARSGAVKWHACFQCLPSSTGMHCDLIILVELWVEGD